MGQLMYLQIVCIGSSVKKTRKNMKNGYQKRMGTMNKALERHMLPIEF